MRVRAMMRAFSSRSLVMCSRVLAVSPSPLMMRISASEISLAFSWRRFCHAATSRESSSLVSGSRVRVRMSFETRGSEVEMGGRVSLSWPRREAVRARVRAIVLKIMSGRSLHGWAGGSRDEVGWSMICPVYLVGWCGSCGRRMSRQSG